MNLFTIFSAATLILVIMLLMVMIFSRYTKAGPNQVLVISGRRRQLPDGTVVGFRFVKGGGTFVFPVIEKVDALSLEVFTIEMPRTKARTADGDGVEVDCSTQIKINSDDASIASAAECFLSKNPAEIKVTVRPVLEKHLVEALRKSSTESVVQNPAACAAAMQSAASQDVGRMGLSIISIALRNARAT
jgi:flotillin